jgi:threonine synthase
VGKPIAAGIVDDDGATHVFPDPDEALRLAGDYRAEFYYQYRPEALPEPFDVIRGLWRYQNLLPVDPGTSPYPLPVGDTPLHTLPDIRQATGIPNLWLKDETRSPTLSNKDRATALVLQHAMNVGIKTVTCASTGNVAVSLAVGAAAIGRHAVVFVPSGVSESKLVLMLACGATVLKVNEGYRAAVRLSREAAAAFGWGDRNTGINPITLDGKKTVALEIWEQLGREVPDVVIVPAGDGTTLSGMAKGFRELVACGAALRMPRIVGVQAEGAQPIKQAWETRSRIHPVQAATIADGIAVGEPISGAMAVRDVRESEGGFVSVSDAGMLDAMRLLATAGGVLAEVAGAASVAGLRPALDAGLIHPGERVVALITGSAFKTPQFLAPAGSAFEVQADLDEVERALARAGSKTV